LAFSWSVVQMDRHTTTAFEFARQILSSSSDSEEEAGCSRGTTRSSQNTISLFDDWLRSNGNHNSQSASKRENARSASPARNGAGRSPSPQYSPRNSSQGAQQQGATTPQAHSRLSTGSGGSGDRTTRAAAHSGISRSQSSPSSFTHAATPTSSRNNAGRRTNPLPSRQRPSDPRSTGRRSFDFLAYSSSDDSEGEERTRGARTLNSKRGGVKPSPRNDQRNGPNKTAADSVMGTLWRQEGASPPKPGEGRTMWVLAHGDTHSGGHDSPMSFVGVQQALEVGAYLQVTPFVFFLCVCMSSRPWKFARTRR
jgi:hypothetical protein